LKFIFKLVFPIGNFYWILSSHICIIFFRWQ